MNTNTSDPDHIVTFDLSNIFETTVDSEYQTSEDCPIKEIQLCKDSNCIHSADIPTFYITNYTLTLDLS